ncbi:MAG: BamA/TamA family outer membrane protein [Flavobacteriales bacterium]|nr:BamA/TamA family outer membrane protein [Flavobacteriales bacterium]
MNYLIRNILAKIHISVVIYMIISAVFLSSCAVSKKVPQGEHLVTSNKVMVNGKKQLNPEFSQYIRQVPNKKFFGVFPVKMNLYMTAAQDPQESFDRWGKRNKTASKVLRALFSQKGVDRIDSTYVKYTNSLKSMGEAPVLYESSQAERSVKNIDGFYFQRGYFNVNAKSNVEFVGDKAEVTYDISTGKAYVLDTIDYDIESQTLVDLYEKALPESLIKSGQVYSQKDFEAESERLTKYFKENGVYDFLGDNIRYVIDTNGYNGKAQVLVRIENDVQTTSTGTYSVAFHPWMVSKINVFTDYQYDTKTQQITDTTLFKGLNIYNKNTHTYRPRVLSDAIFIRQGEVFSLTDYTDTYRSLRNLRMFSSVNISMTPDPDAPQKDIMANIYLTPIKKYSANANFEVSRSSLLGIGTTLNLQLNRYNAFHSGEIWSNTLRGTLGSYNAPDGSKSLFNAYELNFTTALIFPRFLLPFRTIGLVPKRYMPKTSTSLGFGIQKNVGLDRTYFNIGLDYSWESSRTVSHKVGLLKFSYLSNTNKYNYFNIFSNSSRGTALSDYLVKHPDYEGKGVPGSAEWTYFLEEDIYDDQQYRQDSPSNYRIVADDLYQYTRYTSDFVIPAISYTFTFNNQRYDKTKAFHYLQAELTMAGNITNALSGALGLSTSELPTGERVHELFGVPFAQFAKLNVNYSKYITLGSSKTNVLAYRVYFGITLPYGNSQSQIPFSETYFGGGVNYERGWQAYELGPGSVSDKTTTYNIGNLKLTASLEYRFQMYRALHGAVFFDVGNVWYTSSKMYSDERGVFSFDRFYKELSLTSGVGIRYDFTYFIGRIDLGFKTVDPALPSGQRFSLFKYGIAVRLYSLRWLIHSDFLV